MTDFVVALGLIAVIEGLCYAAAPGLMRRALSVLMEQPEQRLRIMGIVAMAVGVATVWAARG